MYRIKDYRAAGLQKPSWINVKSPLIVPFTALMAKQMLGKLSKQDAKDLMNLYNQYWHIH
ncbi:hypothetical protein YK48G_12910 [Lentilactobacillus fungorum]|uniref:Uncharacterized protein n=1 Tax=Lentilactobacillus fungorum TaxID=2201250 RepID=A0ABQ3VZJ1_9LACO|nr:hypothetical protein YK48G_12910 [Lentilactobacillus fungorum]